MGFLPKDIIAAEMKFRHNQCYICDRLGAAVGCAENGCDRKFHFPCGRRYGCVTEFIDKFHSYCHSHIKDTNIIKHNGINIICHVCNKTIVEYNPAKSIISNCCKKTYDDEGITDEKELAQDKFVCNLCVQRYAVNAGYDAMCIMCPMVDVKKEVWQNEMRKKGIYVPYQMATWENSDHFKKQVKRKCSQPNCPNPKLTTNVWTCRVCGCFPLHLRCAKVASQEEYLCFKCMNQSFVQRVPIW